MGDYGLRISQTGDVKTVSDLDCAVTSKYANLKGALSGGGTKSVPSGTTQTVSIYHNLGHIPMFKAIADVYNDGEYAVLPWQVYNSLSDYLVVSTRATTTYAYIDMKYRDVGTRNIPYKYFIFIDKGKI